MATETKHLYVDGEKLTGIEILWRGYCPCCSKKTITRTTLKEIKTLQGTWSDYKYSCSNCGHEETDEMDFC